MHDLASGYDWDGDLVNAQLRCPKCQSVSIESRNTARRFGGALGAIAGATSGVALAVADAEVGLLAGPVGVLLGAVAGIVIDGVVGGAAGCAAGSKLGAVIDQNILHNQRCRDCGYTYSENPA